LQSAWRHDTFDNLSITVPSDPGCKLEKLIKGYTAPEFIHGYICEKCSIVATAKRLQAELAEAKKAKNKNSLKQLKEHYHIIQNAIKRQKYDIQLVICFFI
jgi:peptide subunit release factor 1 (eRF1)